MKKISILLASLLTLTTAVSTPVKAQEETPNRMLLVDKNNYYSGYNIEWLNNFEFKTVEGKVIADVEFLGLEDLDQVKLSVVRSEACKYFRLSLLTNMVAENMNDIAAIRYVESYGTEPYYEDFDSAVLSGLNLKYGTDYALMTVGYDEYDTPVGVSRAVFSTPPVVIVGNPYVETTISNVKLDSFVATFTPNDDVSQYYPMLFEAGTWEEYLAMWGPSFGLTTISELIEFWYQGNGIFGPKTMLFNDDIDPGTAYDIIIAVKDINGNFAPHQSVYVKTETLGGSGDAYVDIELGDFQLEPWYGEMRPSQYIYYWPNSETARYRFEVYYDYQYERFGDELAEELMQEPPQPGMAYWWFFDPIVTDYPLDPGETYYAIAVAQNADGVWGEPNVFKFTTPDECPGWNPTNSSAKIAPVEKGRIAHREVNNAIIKENSLKGMKAVKMTSTPKPVIIQ